MNTAKLSQDDLDAIHDVVFNALGVDATKDQTWQYWHQLPAEIKSEVLKWGGNDTPTREKMYLWFSQNLA